MKKYEITTGWYNEAKSWCEGSKGYSTINELIDGYKIQSSNKKIVKVGLSCEYLNSICWRARDEQERKDYVELNNLLAENGIINGYLSFKAKM